MNELKNQHLTLLNELNKYNKKLSSKIKLIVLNKSDQCNFINEIENFNPLKKCKKITTSCINGSGVKVLIEAIENLKL